MATEAKLAAALMLLRERCGLTQVQLSRRAGGKPQFVLRLESPWPLARLRHDRPLARCYRLAAVQWAQLTLDYQYVVNAVYNTE
jgi:hypothetical protein